jgi:predicted ATPase
VARRRDVRRFGPGPYVLGMRRGPLPWGEGFPYDVPAVAAIEELALDAPITLLAGDNGTGKSTIVEAIAGAMGFAAEGGELERLGELPAVPHPVLGDTLQPVHEQSHGQSFLALAANRFGGHNLYVLDEPEAALSVSGALALLGVLVRGAEAGAQFIIATHSPVLLACPGARIYELDETGLAPCEYDDLEAVRFTRGFLDAPERFIRAALDE